MSKNQENSSDDLTIYVDEFEYRQMRPSDREKVVPLMAKYLGGDEPVNVAFAKKFKMSMEEKIKNDTKLWNLWFDNANSTSLSSVIIDTSKNGEIAGLMIAQDASFKAEEVAEQLAKNKVESGGKMMFGEAFWQMEDALKQKAPEHIRPLLSAKGQTAYFWGALIKPEYRCRNLGAMGGIHGMQLSVAQGYKYQYTVATNINTIKLAAKIPGVSKASTIDVKDFEVDGIKPFELLSEQNRYATVLFRVLQGDESSLTLKMKPKL